MQIRTPQPLLLCLLILSYCTLQAQSDYTLEQVDMSPVGDLKYYSTYVLDINNRGYFCGYYTNSLKENVGFIVTRKGVHFDIDVSLSGSTDTKVVSISDNNVALVSSNSGGETTLWKIYVGDEQMSSLVKVNGVAINTVTALKINNRNDISGWYQGQNSRWLFVLHDSIVPPGKSAWQASRYMLGTTYYNTFGGGMDTNNTVAGFYNNSPNFYPFLYNANTDKYQILSAPARTKIWDMNNSRVMAGEYQQANGVYMACIGEVQGSTLNTTSLDFIFHSNSIASVANGINDKGHVVGQFLDPNTKTWKGFIYRPGKDRYGYEGYDASKYKKHTWSFENTDSYKAGDTYAHWNIDFFNKYIDYSRTDNYLNDGSPLLDSEMKTSFNIESVPNNYHIDWKSYCIEVDNKTTLVGSALDKAYYKTIYKKQLFESWLTWIDDADDSTKYFAGDCFGFATLSLLNYVNPNVLHDWYNIPKNVDLFSFNNMDSTCKSAIARAQFKLNNPVLEAKYYGVDIPQIPQWYGLYRTKTYMLDTLQKVDIRTLTIGGMEDSSNWSHAVFPHHIHTPKKLPFRNPTTLSLESDTVIVYDPNYSDSPGRFVKVRSDNSSLDNTGIFSFDYELNSIQFNCPTYTELYNTPYTFNPLGLASSKTQEILAAQKQDKYRFSFSRRSDYTLRRGAQLCVKSSKSYNNKISQLIDVKGTGVKAYLPKNFLLDTALNASFVLSKYADSQMRITQTIDDVSMSMSRKATIDQHDNGFLAKRTICYGNPENITKNIGCSFTQSKGKGNKAVNISATAITMVAFDSLITRVPRDYCYEIIHPREGSLSYDLNVYALFPTEVKHYSRKNITISARSSHTIDPYYSSSSSSKNATIFIDNNLDGIADDSTTVGETPVGVESTLERSDWIQIYPNPVTDFMSLSVDEAHVGAYTIIVSDLKGAIVRRVDSQMLHNNNSFQLDLSTVAAGTYTLLLVDKEQKVVLTKRFVKE